MANLFRATPMRAVRTVFLGVRTVLEEVAAQVGVRGGVGWGWGA